MISVSTQLKNVSDMLKICIYELLIQMFSETYFNMKINNKLKVSSEAKILLQKHNTFSWQ